MAPQKLILACDETVSTTDAKKKSNVKYSSIEAKIDRITGVKDFSNLKSTHFQQNLYSFQVYQLSILLNEESRNWVSLPYHCSQ